MPFGGAELLLILLLVLIIFGVVLIIFGAGKLPQVFSSLGKGVQEFREAAKGKDDQTSASTPVAASTTDSTTRSKASDS